MHKDANADRSNSDFIEIAATIVAAYVSNNSVPVTELADLIGSVHATVFNLSGAQPTAAEISPPEPAVSVKKSVTRDFIICLEDGKKYKSLRRHLMTSYDMTPDDYRAKWDLPRDYPMVAPGYAEKRSQLAKTIGLGRKISSVKTPVAPSRGRPRKAT